MQHVQHQGGPGVQGQGRLVREARPGAVAVLHLRSEVEEESRRPLRGQIRKETAGTERVVSLADSEKPRAESPVKTLSALGFPRSTERCVSSPRRPLYNDRESFVRGSCRWQFC